MSNITYQTLVPYPNFYLSNLMLSFEETDIPTLQSDIDYQKSTTASQFTFGPQTDGNGNTANYFVSRDDSTKEVTYSNFNNAVPIQQYTHYTSDDGQAYTDCLSSQGITDTPEECVEVTLVQSVDYTISSS